MINKDSVGRVPDSSDGVAVSSVQTAGSERIHNHGPNTEKHSARCNQEFLYSNCRLCPFQCGVNRLKGETGRCGASSGICVTNIQKHEWEEPCLSGQGLENPVKGSGTVFFTHCSLGCVYCQNSRISSRTTPLGRTVSPEVLASEMLRLQESGVHNINLVTPTHFVPGIITALVCARQNGLNIPVVYNSGGYESIETLNMLDGLIDIYLPDYKYFSSRLSSLYSHAPDYREKCEKAIAAMQKQTGKPVFDEKGFLKKGTIIRHLILPGCDYDSVKIISEIFRLFGRDGVILSLMSQFTPVNTTPFPELNVKLPAAAYLRVVSAAQKLKFKYVYTQGGDSAAESFIPDFI